ncbi:PREDICTED: ribosomal RNA processing protein 36 homolog [Ceratosolen solmsi marchali]|uniref:rRNA biogenesis protein RRP36 n=1 Tax=Ceratosolen solmsi marchali TaxID=326594 RepID=A0AAJ6YTK2_9HYME|nr:PREDICTED: ribosomal RNA processing protein 36 homolog [Ceratosolen solmsi marchali]
MNDNETDILLDKDKDQKEIRKELSEMSFENLHELKEKLGIKVYNTAIFGLKNVRTIKFKRENKNRPREETSKKQVSRFREVIPVKKRMIRDPRFDSLCGQFNPKAFKNSYSFLTEVRENDLKNLKRELEIEKDDKQIKKIEYLIQRLQNQLTEENKQVEREQKVKEENQEIVSAIKTGRKPNFKKKSNKRIMNLTCQYEELKKTGKLKKYIERLRKKKIKKDTDNVQLDNPDLEYI